MLASDAHSPRRPTNQPSVRSTRPWKHRLPNTRGVCNSTRHYFANTIICIKASQGVPGLSLASWPEKHGGSLASPPARPRAQDPARNPPSKPARPPACLPPRLSSQAAAGNQDRSEAVCLGWECAPSRRRSGKCVRPEEKSGSKK